MMKNKKIRVAGSHAVRQLGAKGESVMSPDRLTTGFEAAHLVIGNAGDAALMDALSSRHYIEDAQQWDGHPIADDPNIIVRANLAWERKIAARDPGASWRD